MYNRKTKDEYRLMSNYGYGWECELTEDTYREAKDQLKCYRENSNGQHRIEKKRVKIEEVTKC